MTTSRQALNVQIDKALGRRRLYWFGTRGSDATSLADVPQFSGAFSIIDRLKWNFEWSEAWEDSSDGTRIDLDEWDIDEHPTHPATRDLRAAMLTAMDYDHAIVPYRPCEFLSDLTFVRRDHCLYLGMFAGQQRAFEHKPWVETAVAKMDMKWLGWRYLAGRDRAVAEAWIRREGSVVVRPSRGSGGFGMRRIDTVADLDAFWPTSDDTYVNVSAYRHNALPLNIGAVVWDDGVTLHYPSVQLIGVTACTAWPFGYCGNDFGLTKQLPADIVAEIERTALLLGQWLRSEGFRGAFGVDYLLDRDDLLFTEINPRFQGSTRLSAQMSAGRGEPCLLIDHIAALLHLPTPARPGLRELIMDGPAGGHVVLHNIGDRAVYADTSSLIDKLRDDLNDAYGQLDFTVAAPAERRVEAGATLLSMQTRSGLTTDGYRLSVIAEDVIRTAVRRSTRSITEGSSLSDG
ncbi:MAG: ATP-grasp domain-containing protein [Propionibacteriaceae bacterium]|jgi:hypothetical protein|nr:ATP-grasp domain-containing protein [Propionibacteriaceae bacterium]